MLVGIVMLLVVSGIGVIYQYSQRSNDELKVSAIDKIGTDLVDTVEKVYYIGGDSWETLRIQVPAEVNAIYQLNTNELVIEYENFGGLSQAVFFTDVPINMSYYNPATQREELSSFFHTGLNKVRVVSRGSYVEISEVP